MGCYEKTTAEGGVLLAILTNVQVFGCESMVCFGV